MPTEEKMSNFSILLFMFPIVFLFGQVKSRWAGIPLLSFTNRFAITACAAVHRSHTPACPEALLHNRIVDGHWISPFIFFYLVNNFHQQFFASLVELQKLQEGCLTPDLLQNSSTQLCLVGAAEGWRGRPVVQLQNLFLLLTIPEPEMSQLFLNIPTELLSYLIYIWTKPMCDTCWRDPWCVYWNHFAEVWKQCFITGNEEESGFLRTDIARV